MNSERHARRIGVILTPDNASDPELVDWCPPGVSVHTTRLPLPDDWSALDMSEQSFRLSDPDLIAAAVRSLVLIEPSVVTYACTSGGFVRPPSHDIELRRAMQAAGATIAQSTIQAMLAAFARAEVRRIGLVTPYDQACSLKLREFVLAAGYEVTSLEYTSPLPGATSGSMTAEELCRLARAARLPETELVFVSCTGLRTKELLGPLSVELQVPVLSSTQVTMEQAIGAALR